MIRDILTNRWFLGGCGFLIVFAFGCYLWYQHELSPYKQQATETHQQLEAFRNDDKDSRVEKTADADSSEESTSITTEKTIGETTNTVVDENASSGKTDSNLTRQTQETEPVDELRISRFGFGPYPEVPEDFPYPAVWDVPYTGPYDERAQIQDELLCRVGIKLWTQGIKSFGGVFGDDGLVYPNLKNTVYVEWAYRGAFNNLRYPKRIRGDPSAGRRIRDISFEKRERRESFTDADIPSDIIVIPFEEGGIDPYTFLDLPK